LEESVAELDVASAEFELALAEVERDILAYQVFLTREQCNGEKDELED
jgi:hypothetical protein